MLEYRGYEGSCGKRYGGCGGRCKEVCWEVRKYVWGVEKCGKGCGRVYGVSGEVCWRVGRGMGEVWGSVLGCGAPTHFLPHFPKSPSSPFPTSPLTSPHPNTLSYTSSHISSHIFPSYPTPQHIFLVSPHLPSPSQNVAKLPCD